MSRKALINALGYPMSKQIESEIGFSRREMRDLLERMIEKKECLITEREKIIIIKCLEVCLKYIDAWEFPATFDHEKEEVQKFYDQLSKKANN